jgi:hypothetical protein
MMLRGCERMKKNATLTDNIIFNTHCKAKLWQVASGLCGSINVIE